jgi:hypothetical protein
MTDIIRGTVAVFLGVVLCFTLLLIAVLFAQRSAPATRLVKLIEAVRNRTSGR